MKINIQTPGISESKSLIKFVNKSLKQLSKDHSSMLLVASVVLKIDNTSYEGGKLCEIYLNMSNRNIFVIQKGSSFEDSTVKAVKKLHNQITNMEKTGIAGDKLNNTKKV